jgi:hypothetical protein
MNFACVWAGMWETRNANDGGRENIKEHKGTRDFFIPGLGGQAAASLLAAAFASPSCIQKGEGWGVSTGQIRGAIGVTLQASWPQGSPRRGVWNSDDFCVCPTKCARSSNGQRRATAAQCRKASWQWMGGWVRLSAKNQRDAPFLPPGILPRTRNGKCGLLAQSLRNDGRDGSLLRHSRRNSAKSSSLVWQRGPTRSNCCQECLVVELDGHTKRGVILKRTWANKRRPNCSPGACWRPQTVSHCRSHALT